jgi:hypothetical protein
MAGAQTGHVGFTARALPAIQPVDVVVDGDRVVIPTRFGDRLATACHGAVVAVQADSYERGGATAWSVEVVGAARVVTDPLEVTALDRLALQTWTAPEDRCYVSVDMGVVSGWRVMVASVAPTPHPCRE